MHTMLKKRVQKYKKNKKAKVKPSVEFRCTKNGDQLLDESFTKTRSPAFKGIMKLSHLSNYLQSLYRTFYAQTY